jgi:hypothetical protein
LHAQSWKERSMLRMTTMCGGRFRVDGCRHGTVHPVNNQLGNHGVGFQPETTLSKP